MESLADGNWSYDWSKDKIQMVLDSLDEMANIKEKIDLPTAKELHSDLFCWKKIIENPNIFTNSGIAPREELENVMPSIVKLAESAQIDGDGLVHMDIRSDNICFYKNRAVFVDWNHACIGNSKLDMVFWLPSVYLEGGSKPWDFSIDEPELIALIIGYFAYNSSLEPPHEGSKLRDLQKSHLKIMYAWLLEILGKNA